ncbi:DUF6545 domain-containing protein [Streptomyces sp. FXJ1.4098]|nr:DUF6545 domain-containing protein [Streptomyces sp. FXJ1.4098]
MSSPSTPDLLDEAAIILQRTGLHYRDLATFRTQLSRWTDRTITLHPLSPTQSVYLGAVRVSTRTSDYIFYPQGTSRVHRDHLIVRELMESALLQHVDGITSSDVETIVPHIAMDPQAAGILSIEDDSHLSDLAEMLATLIGAQSIAHLLGDQTDLAVKVARIKPLWTKIGAPVPESNLEYLDTAVQQLYRQVIDIHEAELVLQPYRQLGIEALVSAYATVADMTPEAADAAVTRAGLEAAQRAWWKRAYAGEVGPPLEFSSPPERQLGFLQEVERLSLVAEADQDAALMSEVEALLA